MEKIKKEWYKRWWAIILFIVLIGGLIGSFFEEEKSLNSSTNQETRALENYSVNQLKDLCVDLCVGGDDIPYIKTECKSSCSQLYYYGGKEALIKEINTSTNISS